MSEGVYNAIILNEPYADMVDKGTKTIETRMRKLSKLTGEIIICCDGTKSKGSPNSGKALCIVNVGKFRDMVKEDEAAACIACIPGRIAYPLSNWRYFSYNFIFTDYHLSGDYRGVFQIKLPKFTTIETVPDWERPF